MISSADNDPDQEYSEFFREYSRVEVLSQPLTERELWDKVSLYHPGEQPLITFLGHAR